jgi:hypothetical protein
MDELLTSVEESLISVDELLISADGPLNSVDELLTSVDQPLTSAEELLNPGAGLPWPAAKAEAHRGAGWAGLKSSPPKVG